MFFKFLLIFLFFKNFECAPSVQNALVYLSRYGYLEPNNMGNSSQINAKSFRKSLMEFQSFAGLPKTGKLDRLTLETMSMPRCGMKDMLDDPPLSGNFENFQIEGSKWQVKNLRYRITKYPSRLNNRQEVDSIIQRAFNLWSKYTDLTFEPTTGRAHIEIRFETGRHGDGDGFDGPGGTLAHAFFPRYGGATHFDDTEPWVLQTNGGTDLFQVAAHEFGHALGLKHSEIRDALMAPFYKGFIPNIDLYQDDISGIQRLYGGKGGGNPSPNPNQPPSNPGPRQPSFPNFPGGFPNFPSGFPNLPRGFPNFPSGPSNPDQPPSNPNQPPSNPDQPPSNPEPRQPSFPNFPRGFPNFPSGGFPSFPRGFPNFPNFPVFRFGPVYRRTYRREFRG